MISTILTDIEGTTGSVDFVHKVLFPYSAERLPVFVRQNAEDPSVRPWLERAAADLDCAPDDMDAVVAGLLGWIAEDRKHPALKALQGMIWEAGYQEGAFKAHIYADAAVKLRAWAGEDLPIYVYSSGSVWAQKLYFGHTEAGDLRDCLSGYFDTAVGHKRELASYARIVTEIGCDPAQTVFLSDIIQELDAAADAGLQTRLVDRADAHGAHTRHIRVRDFAELDF